MGRPAHALLDALSFAFGMGWEILWAPILGFALSGAVEAVVSKREMRRLLPDSSPRWLAIATALGAASFSCSYAAVALARSLEGADFITAIAFEIASTDLDVELGIIMALALGWQFTAAEFVGGPIVIIIATVLLRRLVRPHGLEAVRRQAERGLRGSMEAHATRDMSVQGSDPLLRRLTSTQGIEVLTQIAAARTALEKGALEILDGHVNRRVHAAIAFGTPPPRTRAAICSVPSSGS